MIGLLKKKTIWYVILRAIREKTRPMISGWEKNRKMDVSETIEKTSRRLTAIQKWLGYSDAILDQWKMLSGQFIGWLADGAKKKSITRDDIADLYPILWTKFLDETKNNDDFMKEMTENNREEDVWKELNEMKINEKKKPRQTQARKTKQPSDLEYEEDIDLSLQDPDEVIANDDDEIDETT